MRERVRAGQRREHCASLLSALTTVVNCTPYTALYRPVPPCTDLELAPERAPALAGHKGALQRGAQRSHTGRQVRQRRPASSLPCSCSHHTFPVPVPIPIPVAPAPIRQRLIVVRLRLRLRLRAVCSGQRQRERRRTNAGQAEALAPTPAHAKGGAAVQGVP
jgi:hypothetical protein